MILNHQLTMGLQARATHPAHVVMGIEPRALCMAVSTAPTEPHLQAPPHSNLGSAHKRRHVAYVFPSALFQLTWCSWECHDLIAFVAE